MLCQLTEVDHATECMYLERVHCRGECLACMLKYIILVQLTYVTGFGKTDHIVTIDISRNTDLKD